MKSALRSGWVALIASLIASASPAKDAAALATYVYTGNPFDTFVDRDPPAGSYDASMRVTGSISLDAPLPSDLPLTTFTLDLLAARWSDGRRTITALDQLRLATDATGAIVEWEVAGLAFTFAGGNIAECQDITSFGGTPGGQLDQGRILFGDCFAAPLPNADAGSVSGNPGSWTLVPEPGTALLAGLGLVLLAAGRPCGSVAMRRSSGCAPD